MGWLNLLGKVLLQKEWKSMKLKYVKQSVQSSQSPRKIGLSECL